MSDILNGFFSCVIVPVFDDIFLFPSVFTVTIDRTFSISSVQHVFICSKDFSAYNLTLLSPTKIISFSVLVGLI